MKVLFMFPLGETRFSDVCNFQAIGPLCNLASFVHAINFDSYQAMNVPTVATAHDALLRKC